jgi:hypothetical protein
VPSVTIVDLDAALAEPKQVKLGGKVWKLPAQVPVPLYLRAKQRAKELAEDPDADVDQLEEVHREVLALFQVYQPDLEAVPCGIFQLFGLIERVYGGGQQEPGEAKRTAARTGSKKPPPKRRSARSRS